MAHPLPPLPDLSRDFHTLTSYEVGVVTAHADAAKYRKPRTANGSRARYFWSKLQRDARRGLSQVRVYDNGGETMDRYTAVYMALPEHRLGLYSARGMCENPTHPMGFGCWTSAEPGRHLGKRIAFDALPEACRAVVLADIKGVAA